MSPDGRWLAYASTRTGRLEVWVQGYPEGVAVRVSSDSGYEPRWSADGRELYYLRGDSVMAVTVQGVGELSFSAPEKLFSDRTSCSSWAASYRTTLHATAASS